MSTENPRPSERVSRELVESAQQGDKEALAQIIRLTQTDVYTLALRLVGDPDEALDVAQEAYVRALRGLKKFRGESAFSTWLYRVTANTAYTYKTKARRRRAESLEAMRSDARFDVKTSEPGPERIAMGTIAYEDVVAALDRLSPGARAVVVLKDVYGLTHEEIADSLGISVTACKVRLCRARQRLKEILTSKGSAAATV